MLLESPSSYQQAIFDWATAGSGNLTCNAVAGSGKSTTLRALATDFIGCLDSVLAITFAKANTEALTAIMPSNVKCSTLNSFGLSLCKQISTKVKIESNKTKYKVWDNYDKSEQAVWSAIPAICNLISLAKGHMYDVPDLMNNYSTLANKYGIELPEEEDSNFRGMLEATYIASLADKYMLDFDDMLLYPVLHNCTMPVFDWILVDEAQDLNPVQIELVSRLAKTGARVVAVGDRSQAIYGFRGADINSMENIKATLNAEELPLSICYRCSRRVVELARTLVPHIEPSPTAADGSVTHITSEEFRSFVSDGDMVLCRTTAPLVSSCLRLIRNNRKAIILGRKFGDSLVSLVEKIATKPAVDITTFTALADRYFTKEIDNALRKGQTNKAQDLSDKQETLAVLADGCSDSSCIISRIEHIFSDTSTTGITHSTIHRAKGMECSTVYLLRPDLLPHPMAKQPWELTQELNMQYVAYTRAKMQLVLVEKEML